MARKDKEMLERLEVERNRLRKEIEALQNQLFAFERAIALAKGEEVPGDAPANQRARNVKDSVLSFLAEAGPAGLTVTQIMERAQAKGKHLERGSVSSLLSRLKREHVLDFEDGAYRIRRPPTIAPAQAIHTH